MTEISSFELDVDVSDGGRRKYRLHRLDSTVTAKVSRRDPGCDRQVERGKRAVEEAERLLDVMQLHPNMDETELLARTCGALLLDAADIDYLDVEVEFTTRTELTTGIAERHPGSSGKNKKTAGSRARAANAHS